MNKADENIKVLDRAFSILECFSESRQELSMMEIAELTDLSPSTAFRIMKTMENKNYLFRNEESKKYSLGPKITYLGSVGKGASLEMLKAVIKPYMTELRKEFNETISLYIRQGDKKVCIERLESTQSLRQVITIGELYSVKLGASGRVLLAYAPERIQEELIGSDEALQNRMERVRAKGYSVTNGERSSGVAAIAAPIFNGQGKIMGAFSLSGPSARIISEDLYDKVEAVKGYALKISQEMGYKGNQPG